MEVAGVRIAHQPTEPPTEEPTPLSEYNDEDDDYVDEDPPPAPTTPIPIVKLKKLNLPRQRPSIARKRPTRVRGEELAGNAVGPIKSKAPKQSRPAFGILSRPKKTTVAPGPRTVRPFVKVFDRARERPKMKAIQQVRIRKLGMRITTAKPVRKGFPIGPPKSALPPPSAPSGPSLADFEEIYRRQKGQNRGYETSTYRTVEEDVPDDLGEPDSQVPLVYYEGQTRITDGWEWSPYLDDRNTKEFKYLAFHVKQQLKSFLDETRYGDFLNYILIDGFNKGVEVDFFLVFYQTEPMIDDQELTEDIRDVMAYKSDNDYEFVLDPNATSFKFKYVKTPASERLVEPPLLPNWAIAMLVFGFGSLVLVAGSLIMANNFRSSRRLKDIKKKKMHEKELQLQMTHLPHRYPEAVKGSSAGKETGGKKGQRQASDTRSSGSAQSSRSNAASLGTLDKRPPMLERYQRDYGAYEQKIPPSDRLYGEYEDQRRRRANDLRCSNYTKKESRNQREASVMDPNPMSAIGDGYSTIGSHFPSSFKSLLQPSRSILYRPTR
ncbi:hypothetical protein BIW11_00530 [Tropilaelaps mercedesae]|uniref:SEA domain-containing protein n=1 Tax=Tropilaelaps mercedesae TaxID=418985 RepID=A0A1V9XTU9_9ACAR|nr:hypothetical protein BIW11_00530 [Tropilaelaps mercedesae]